MQKIILYKSHCTAYILALQGAVCLQLCLGILHHNPLHSTLYPLVDRLSSDYRFIVLCEQLSLQISTMQSSDFRVQGSGLKRTSS